MTARLGPRQIEALALASGCRLVGLAPTRTDRALIQRGLLRADWTDAYCITPAGLRAVADAMEAGRIEDGLGHWQRRTGRHDRPYS